VRVVLDTNVIVAGLVASGLCHELIEEYLPRHEPILSGALWDELEATLTQKLGLDPDDLPFLHLYRGIATWVEPDVLGSRVSRDPDDDVVLGTAVAGGAEVIVSGDEDLLTLGSFAGVEIWSPRQFLEHLTRCD
jgi:putative PIN family toxin of toxin-antitoxin system